MNASHIPDELASVLTTASTLLAMKIAELETYQARHPAARLADTLAEWQHARAELANVRQWFIATLPA